MGAARRRKARSAKPRKKRHAVRATAGAVAKRGVRPAADRALTHACSSAAAVVEAPPNAACSQRKPPRCAAGEGCNAWSESERNMRRCVHTRATEATAKRVRSACPALGTNASTWLTAGCATQRARALQRRHLLRLFAERREGARRAPYMSCLQCCAAAGPEWRERPSGALHAHNFSAYASDTSAWLHASAASECHCLCCLQTRARTRVRVRYGTFAASMPASHALALVPVEPATVQRRRRQ